MRHIVSIAAASALTLVLWLVLLMPDRDFLGQAWIPAVAWLVFINLAWFPGILPSILRVDAATYGPIALLMSALIPVVGASLAAAALITARFASGSYGPVAILAAGPFMGAAFVLLLMTHVVSIGVFTRHSIGTAGQLPILDDRPKMHSHDAPPRSESEFAGRPVADSPPSSRPDAT